MKILRCLPLLLVGCGSPAPGPTNFAAINQQILFPSCGKFSSCHSTAGQNSAGKLNLEVNPYASLVGVAADNPKAKSEGRLRVKPGDAANSFLYMKLTLPVADDPGGYEDRMPQQNEQLPKELIEGIRKWIDAGAAND